MNSTAKGRPDAGAGEQRGEREAERRARMSSAANARLSAVRLSSAAKGRPDADSGE